LGDDAPHYVEKFRISMAFNLWMLRTAISLSHQRVEQFQEAHRGFTIWLDPFGMLDPQVVVNLLPELGVGVDFVRHSNWLIWNVHL